MEREVLTTVSIVSNVAVKRYAAKNCLKKHNQIVISEFTNAEDFLYSIKESCPEVVLIGLKLKGMNGIEAIQKIKETCPRVKIIILTPIVEKDFFDAAMALGANALVSRDIDFNKLSEIIKAVKIGAYWFEPVLQKNYHHAFKKPDSFDLLHLYAKKGDTYALTRREKEVLKLLVQGKSNIEIAEEMIVSINTAKAHVGNILTKMNVTDRVQAAVKAIQAELV